MRIVAPVVALLLVGVGALLLVFIFVARVFTIADLLVFLVISGVALALVRFAGRSLDRKFFQSVDEFVRGRGDSLTVDCQIVWAYGVLLIALIPLLIYLEVLVLYAALAFANAILRATNGTFATLYTLLFAVALVLFAAIALLSGLIGLIFPGRSDRVRVLLAPTEHSRLWTVTTRVAECLDARPITRIELAPEPGIAVTLSGNLLVRLLGHGAQTLILGLPSLHGLEEGEFEAILAHEYGHFNNRDTQWYALTEALGRVLTRTLSATPVRLNRVSTRLSFGDLANTAAMNPVTWVLRFFARLFFQVTRGYARFCEVRADLEAIRLHGGETFVRALEKVVVNGLVWTEYVLHGFIEPNLREGQVARNLAELIGIIHEERVTEWTRNRLQERALQEWRGVGPYATHPPLATRLEVAGRFPTSSVLRPTPVQDLFDRWDEITTELTKLYYKRLIRHDRERQSAIAASIRYR